MELEQGLKNLKSLKADEKFKQNLRTRILNEYPLVHTLLNSEIKTNPNILETVQNKISNFFVGFLRFNSALSLTLIIMLFISVGSYGMYILPENVKTTVSEGFKNINKPKVDLEVVSNIDGASVYINDKYVGVTPLDIDVKEGAYAIRIEKDGYIAYQSELKLDESKPSNKINIELPKKTEINKWIEYANNDRKFRFFYPDNWNLIEKKLEDQFRLSQIIVENGNTSLSISLDSDFDTQLLNTQKDKIYVGEINVNNKIYKRYLVFNQFNEFTLGGIWIDDNDLGGKVNIAYNFDDIPQDQILSSEQLNILDQISISYLSSQTNSYVYNPDTFKALANVPWAEDSNNGETSTGSNADVADDEPTPDYVDITDDEETQILSEYINKVYGYQLKLPSSWSLSTGRAEYPFYDRGHLVEKDGRSYKIARLKVYTEKEGIIYIFMTNNDTYEINDGGDLCNSEGDKSIIDISENMQLVSLKQATKYNYQLCKKTESGLNSQTSIQSTKNGNIRYTIYWDATEEEINELKDKFNEFLNSISFDDQIVITPIDKVEYKYKYDPLEFNYKYSWNITTGDVNCVIHVMTEPTPGVSIEPTRAVDTVCKAIKINDGDETLAQITIGRETGDRVTKNDNQVVKRTKIKNRLFSEVFDVVPVCTKDETGVETCSNTEKFAYGVASLNSLDTPIEVKYFRDSESVKSLLGSIILN